MKSSNEKLDHLSSQIKTVQKLVNYLVIGLLSSFALSQVFILSNEVIARILFGLAFIFLLSVFIILTVLYKRTKDHRQFLTKYIVQELSVFLPNSTIITSYVGFTRQNTDSLYNYKLEAESIIEAQNHLESKENLIIFATSVNASILDINYASIFPSVENRLTLKENIGNFYIEKHHSKYPGKFSHKFLFSEFLTKLRIEKGFVEMGRLVLKFKVTDNFATDDAIQLIKALIKFDSVEES